MVKNRLKIAKSGSSMLFGALPCQHVQFECDSCARVYKQGPISAIGNTFLLQIPKFISYQHMRPKPGLKSPRPFTQFFDKSSLSKQNSPRWDAAFCGVISGAIMFAYVP